jgi:TatD DNase family protein
VEKIGLENIVIETDSPYLTPHPFRGEKNSPKNVKIIVEFLSNLFRISPEKVAEITSKNLLEFFDIEW